MGDAWKFTTIALSCGHERSVEVALAVRAERGTLTELWCPTCRTKVPVR